MMAADTYYDLLGVSRHATADQIRAAYIELMKRHHPDRSPTASQTLPDEKIAPLLNRCYAVLRDPDRRAVYDANLAREPHPKALLSPINVRYDALEYGRISPIPKSGAIGILMVAAVALAALAAFANSRGRLDEAAAMAWWPPPSVSEPRPPRASRARIAAAAKRAMSASPFLAVQFSRDCFESGTVARGESDLETCIVFDEAFLYWHANRPAEANLPLYYDEIIVRLRHLGALGGSESEAETRLSELRDATFDVLMSEASHSLVQEDAGLPKVGRTVSETP